MLTRTGEAPVHTTPNATMRTLAAPSLGASALSVWEVAMAEGATGPAHRVDAEQVWFVLEGRLRVEFDGRALEAGAGDALTLPAGVERRVLAATAARALVSSTAAERHHRGRRRTAAALGRLSAPGTAECPRASTCPKLMGIRPGISGSPRGTVLPFRLGDATRGPSG